MKKIILALSLLAALGACNTVKGVGKDVQQGGKAIQKSSGY